MRSMSLETGHALCCVPALDCITFTKAKKKTLVSQMPSFVDYILIIQLLLYFSKINITFKYYIGGK